MHHWTVIWGILLMGIVSLSSPAMDESSYRFISVDEKIDGPWHRSFIENTPTPDDAPNAGAAYLNDFLRAALADNLEKTAARTPWQSYPKFFNWATWAYLSPDSASQGDERLPTMMTTWLEGFLEKLATRPEDPKQAEKWVPNQINDSWSFHDYSLPLLAIDDHPSLKTAIGDELCERYRAIVIASIEAMTQPERYNDLAEKAETYVNIATHPMAVFIHGWLLTGEAKYLRMAQTLVAILHRDQMPNGMFPYRYRIHGDSHLEYETMYYHAINVRALYLYWWATGSRMALECLERSTPWYPLNLEPPYYFNDGADIWWKDQWRTFWPQHVAMKAAATGDGENATIARRMADDRVTHDRFDLVLGAHAYRRMASVPPVPVRDNYVIRDPDIRGLRLRFAPWSSTFTTGSFTYTRASAMLVRTETKGFDALHLARPIIRVAPLEVAQRVEADYTTLGAGGAEHHAVLLDDVAAAGTIYAQALTPDTWAEVQPTAPWRMAELWFMTPHGLIGLIDSMALQDQTAYEFSHQYRFILASGDLVKADGVNAWEAGALRLRIWATDFAQTIQERARRFALNANDRRDHQLSLTDQPRLPEQEAQGESPDPALLPKETTFPAGYRRFSLVSISPASPDEPQQVERLAHDTLIGFSCTIAGKSYQVLLNPTDQPVTWQDSSPAIPPHQVHVVLTTP